MISRAPAHPHEELKEEDRKIRRLRIVVNMVMQAIAQDHTLTVEKLQKWWRICGAQHRRFFLTRNWPSPSSTGRACSASCARFRMQ